MNVAEIAYQLSVWAIPIVIAITFHEAAHGWVAWRCGDDTAKRLGRVTFNPLKHIDPFGTILLPGMLLFLSGGRIMFGFAKPVPVNFGRLRRPRQDMVIVAAAGPATNIGLAFASALALLVVPASGTALTDWAQLNLLNSIWINVLLAVFNMLPIPPLDGGRVAVGLLPAPLAEPLARLERVGFFIILGAIFLLPWLGGRIGINIDLFGWLVIGPAQYLSHAILAAVGLI